MATCDALVVDSLVYGSDRDVGMVAPEPYLLRPDSFSLTKEKGKVCEFSYFRLPLHLSMAFATRKDLPYKADINRGILRMTETGILQFVSRYINHGRRVGVFSTEASS